MMRLRLVLSCLGSLLVFCPSPVFARENHALLIGASSYTNLEERYWLVGPANDVDLVRTYLTQNETVPFESDNVTILADGVPDSAAPTLANIRSEMAALTARIGSDDFVYLHFSGHGTQAPAQDTETELDGLDELFLPVDIGLWSDTTGSVENALIDDEIGRMVAQLRATGATVWAVFDSCHSGTVTRAAPGDDTRLRKLAPSALGVPDAAIDDAENTPLTRSVDPRTPDVAPIETTAPSAPAQGDFIAFYAAQSNESTPEKRLPRGKPGRRSQGVFTYTVFETLASNPGISYRQLGQEILRKYATEGRARSTPMFVGDLDSPVFANGNVDTVTQWPVTLEDSGSATLPAGRLHRLEQGDRLALLSTPADPNSAAIGYVLVDQIDTFSAQLILTKDSALDGLGDLPKGSYARRLDKKVDFALTVELPDPASSQNAGYNALSAGLSYGAEADLMPNRVIFVPNGDPADLRMEISEESGTIIVLPSGDFIADKEFENSPQIETTGKSAEQLTLDLVDTFARMNKVQNLLKLGGLQTGNGLDVVVTLQSRQPGSNDLGTLDPVPIPKLVPGDEVHILAQNQEITPIDLNVLYIGSDYSITHMFKGRLHPGDTLKQGLLRITDDSFGRDRIMLFLTPADTHSAVEDFGFLAQSELPITRAVGANPFSQQLIEAGFGETLRAAVALNTPDENEKSPIALSFDIDTKPLN